MHSARYAGEHATDADNNALLLRRPARASTNRTARFVCVIALVKDGALVRTFRGAVEGRSSMARAAPAASATIRCSTTRRSAAPSAKRPIEDKMQVSHRAQALEAMFTYLRNTAST